MLFLLFSFTGCKNPCQQLCDEIADFVKNECESELGESFSKEQIKECRIEYRWQPKEERQACSIALPKLKEEWTCEDMVVYFDDGDDFLPSENNDVEANDLFGTSSEDTALKD